MKSSGNTEAEDVHLRCNMNAIKLRASRCLDGDVKMSLLYRINGAINTSKTHLNRSSMRKLQMADKFMIRTSRNKLSPIHILDIMIDPRIKKISGYVFRRN